MLFPQVRLTRSCKVILQVGGDRVAPSKWSLPENIARKTRRGLRLPGCPLIAPSAVALHVRSMVEASTEGKGWYTKDMGVQFGNALFPEKSNVDGICKYEAIT